MTDGPNDTDNTELLNENVWEAFSNWLHCICVVTFDLELGQALEVLSYLFNLIKLVTFVV